MEPEFEITPELKADAPRILAGLRTGGPVQRVRLGSGLEAWAVLTYEEARVALTHPALLKDATPAEKALDAAGSTAHRAEGGFGASMLYADPPDHTRLRRLAAPAFSPRRTQQLAGRVREIGEELLDAMEAAGEADLVEAYTAPLPITVISEMLGVPEDERTSFRVWSQLLTAAPSPEQAEAGRSLSAYLAGLVSRKRAAPGDDLLSDMIAEQNAQDGRLSDVELIGAAMLLVVAGNDTTVNLLGNAMVALFEHPEQAELLRADPGLIPGAVEEFLRYDSSVEQAPPRFAAQDLELGGVTIRRGDIVAVYLSSANRDAAQPDGGDPDVLDVARPNARHVAFGHGIHHCLGAPLARMEAVIALELLLARFPGLRAAKPPAELPWVPSGIMRGPLSLPVVW